MTVTVRTATNDDREACVELLDRLSEATGGTMSRRAGAAFDILVTRERGEVLVAEDSETSALLGLASVTYNVAMRYGGEYCQLEELIVTPAARGRNAGGMLVEAILATARERGCAECGLYLVETTERNRAFYEKYGFLAVGTEMRQALAG